MAKRSKSQRPQKASPPAAEAAARIAPRRKTNGLSVGHIARAEPLSAPRVRQIIAEMPANREIDPPPGFVQFQIAWLSEAMIIARAMMEGNLQAMDRRIGLMGELDRYHGFAAAQILVAPDGAAAPRLARPERRSISPNPARSKVEGKFSASQALEIPRNAEEISDSAERLAAPERRPIPPNPARGKVEGKFSASQTLEIPRNAEGISGAALLEAAAPDPAESGPRREPRRSVAGFAPREVDENGVARKWRRNGLKRLNQRPEMVWPRKPRTYKMWYTGARPTISDTALAASHKKVGQLGSYEGKFSASQALEIPRNANGISAPTIPVCGRRLRGLFAARGAGGAAYGHSSSKRTFCAPSQSVLRPSG